jgi:hypothetical protein
VLINQNADAPLIAAARYPSRKAGSRSVPACSQDTEPVEGSSSSALTKNPLIYKANLNMSGLVFLLGAPCSTRVARKKRPPVPVPVARCAPSDLRV